MIIRRRVGGIVAIAQPDHARLAGVLAKGWRLGPGATSGRRGSLLLAAQHHDDGWLAWELEPTIDEHGHPHDFLTIPMDERVAIYRRGIQQVSAGDLFAGLLTSMHFGRLVAEGLSSLLDPGRRAAETFLAEQVAWEVHRRRELGEPVDAEVDYVVLRAVDYLSLLLCMRPLEDLSGTSLPPVHTAPGEPARAIRMVSSQGRLVLHPYPFDTEPLQVEVPGRALATGLFESNDDYRSALGAARVETLPFTLAAGSTP